MNWQVAAIALTLIAHFGVAAALVALMLSADPVDFSSLRPRDDDGGGGGGTESPDSDPPASGPDGGVPAPLPMPQSDPGSERLREPRPERPPWPSPRRREGQPDEHPSVPTRLR